MNIIYKEDLERLIDLLQPKLDLSNIISIEDKAVSKLLHDFLFLKQYAEEIPTKSPFTYEEVLYSQYYWFVYFIRRYVKKYGYDAGMEQQASMLLEHLSHELGENIDWEFIEKLENQLISETK